MRAVVCALALAAMLVRTVGAAPLEPNDYVRLLRASSADLQRGGAAAAPDVARRLRAVEGVSLPGGVARPDNGAIVAALEARPPDLAGAQAGLRALLGEVDQPASTGRDAARRLETVMARPELAPRPPDLIAQFLRTAWEALWAFLRRQIGDNAPDVASAAPDVGQAIPVLGVLVLGATALILFVVVRRNIAARARVVPTVALSKQSAADWLAAADRAAIRAAYLATVLRLDEAGRLRFDPALTNGEMLASLPVAEGSHAVRAVADRFERVWYGGRDGSAEEYADVAALASQAAEALVA